MLTSVAFDAIDELNAAIAVFRDHAVPKGRININAENGVVFLRGEVDSPELVSALEERVAKVRGVRGVKNLLNASASPA